MVNWTIPNERKILHGRAQVMVMICAIYFGIIWKKCFWYKNSPRIPNIFEIFFCKWFSIRCHSIDSVYEDIMKTKQTDSISGISYNTIVNMSRMYANFAKSGSVFRYCCLLYLLQLVDPFNHNKRLAVFFLLSDGRLLMESQLMDTNQFEDAELVFLT